MRTLSASLVMAFGLYARVASSHLDRAERHERSLRSQLDDALARLLATSSRSAPGASRSATPELGAHRGVRHRAHRLPFLARSVSTCAKAAESQMED